MTAAPIGNAPDAMDVLMGGTKVPTAKFDSPGTLVGGRIIAPPKAHQEREFDRNNPGQGAPKFFPSGDPIYGLTIDVQTNQRDASIEDDDGVRRIWVEGKRLKQAVASAVREAGAQKLEVGGTIEVSFTGFGEAASAGVNPPKEYVARYTPPTGANQQTVLGQAAPPQQAAPPAFAEPQLPQAPPAAQMAPAAPPAQTGPTPEQVAAVRAAGLDPATVFPGFTG